MAEDLTVPRNATLTSDAPPPNSTEASEDLTLPNGRPAPLRVECNVDEEMSLSIPAAYAAFTAWQRVRRQGDEQLVESVHVRCKEEDDGTVTVRVVIWTPKFPDGLQIALLRSRPEDTSTDDDIECDLNHKDYGSL